MSEIEKPMTCTTCLHSYILKSDPMRKRKYEDDKIKEAKYNQSSNPKMRKLKAKEKYGLRHLPLRKLK
jgi:hypothetical protein